ncbi:Guanine deaminase, partial [Dysosmobacter welbionis]
DEDGAVVVDVDLGAGVGHDLLDDLAAGADDLPDLGGVDVHGQHLGRVLADLLAGLGDGGQHDLIQDLAPGVIGDVQGLLDDLHGEAVVLQVHLDGGDALLGTAHLEVHLAVEILHALDVDEGGEGAVVVLDQAAGDAGHRGLDGHAGVHQGQGGAADGALGGGAVGAQHLRHHADGVGELLHRGEHGHQSPLRQSTVADLPAAGGTGGLGLAYGVAGEVVVVHIPLLRLLPDGVQLLVGGEGVQGADGKHLGLATGEEAGAVGPGQHAHLGGQGPDLVLLAAVHAVALQKPLLDDLLLELVGELLQVLVHIRIFLQILLVPLLDHGVPAGLPDVLVVGVHGGLGLVHEVRHDLVEQLLVEIRVRILKLGLAHLGDHLIDQGDDLLVLLMGHLDGLEHLVVGDLVGAGLDHDHLFAGGDHGDVQVA